MVVVSTIAVYYSADYAPLRKVVETRENDATGKGQGEYLDPCYLLGCGYCVN